jgi:DNA-binding protein YbaB
LITGNKYGDGQMRTGWQAELKNRQKKWSQTELETRTGNIMVVSQTGEQSVKRRQT